MIGLYIVIRTEKTAEKMHSYPISQENLQKLFLPGIKSEGQVYKKIKKVLARKAIAGERVETITSDGLETVNRAKDGDFLIQNQTKAREQYIISSKKFNDKYEYFASGDGEFNFYKAKGKVVALEMTESVLRKFNLPDEFSFIAPWKEDMIVKKDDFLVCPPDYSEIYRIARLEFFETYQKL